MTSREKERKGILFGMCDVGVVVGVDVDALH
jgi:hypothetical protein